MHCIIRFEKYNRCIFVLLVLISLSYTQVRSQGIFENRIGVNYLSSGSDNEFNFYSPLVKDSLRIMQKNSFFIGLLGPFTILSINYENSIHCYKRLYLVPQVGIGSIPYPPGKPVISSFHIFLNGNVQIFSPFYFEIGGGYCTNSEWYPHNTCLGQGGFKYIGKKGLYAKLTYNIQMDFSGLFKYNHVHIYSDYAPFSLSLGHSFN